MTATNSYYYLVYCSYNTNSMIKKIAGTKISSNTYILRNCCNDGEFIYGMQGLVSNPTVYNGGLYYRNFSTILNGIGMTDAQATYMGDVTQQLIMRIANIYITSMKRATSFPLKRSLMKSSPSSNSTFTPPSSISSRL